MNIARTSTRAFTITEVLIMMALLGITILPLLELFMSGGQGVSRVADATIASNLSSEKLEILSLLPYRALETNREAYETAETSELAGTKFTRTAEVRELSKNRLIRIDVKVTWIENGNLEKRVALTTLVSNENVD
jgi:hypothetical protein